jgi:hypothetical protein
MTITVEPSETISVVATGGTTPDRLVEVTVKVVPELVTTTSVTNVLVKFAGGTRPLPPVELKAKSDPDVVVLRPSVVVVVVVLTRGPSGTGALGEGGMSPSVPVEMIVAVDPETVTTVELTKVERETFPLGAGKLAEGTAPVVGGMTPESPVEVAVAVEKIVVISPLPVVVEAGTKLGPNSPPPFTITLVEEPEMIVVVAPLMIVVTSSVMTVLGRLVSGCCTIV